MRWKINNLRGEKEYPYSSDLYFIGENPSVLSNKSIKPNIDSNVFIGPYSSIIGNVRINNGVFISCNVTIRADEGTPFYIGSSTNIQDGVIMHGLKDSHFTINNKEYSIYIGNQVNITHGALIHGPCIIEDNVFVGFKAIVFNAIVEEHCYIDMNAIVTDGVRLHSYSYVPKGEIIDTQEKANKLGKASKSKNEFAEKINKTNIELERLYSKHIKGHHYNCKHCYTQHKK